MRTLLAYSVFLLPAGCVSIPHQTGVIPADTYGPDSPPIVIRTRDEFEDFLGRARTLPSASESGGLAGRLESARPDFGRQVLVLVRHDASSDSTFRFDASERRGVLVCDIRTRRSGVLRDHAPHWFAAAVARPGPERVEVRVDGDRQPDGVRAGS